MENQQLGEAKGLAQGLTPEEKGFGPRISILSPVCAMPLRSFIPEFPPRPQYTHSPASSPKLLLARGFANSSNSSSSYPGLVCVFVWGWGVLPSPAAPMGSQALHTVGLWVLWGSRLSPLEPQQHAFRGQPGTEQVLKRGN